MLARLLKVCLQLFLKIFEAPLPMGFLPTVCLHILISVLLGTLLFHAGTELDNGTLVTNRSRVMAAVCIKGTLDEAVYRAYEGVKNIYYKGKYFRKDIGKVLARCSPGKSPTLTASLITGR